MKKDRIVNRTELIAPRCTAFSVNRFTSIDNCCKTQPKFSIFPFYKFQTDDVSARLAKERYFIDVFSPKLFAYTYLCTHVYAYFVNDVARKLRIFRRH